MDYHRRRILVFILLQGHPEYFTIFIHYFLAFRQRNNVLDINDPMYSIIANSAGCNLSRLLGTVVGSWSSGTFPAGSGRESYEDENKQNMYI